MTVTWEDSIIETRVVSGKRRRERRFRVTCDGCGEVRYLKKSDAKKDAPCYRCACRAKGRKGYRSAVAKHGRETIMEKLRAYRLENPSAPERQFQAMLDEHGLPYEREVMVKTDEGHIYLIDFVIDGIAIEVNGWPHQFEDKKARDRIKACAIIKAGYKLLVVPAENLQEIFMHLRNRIQGARYNEWQ